MTEECRVCTQEGRLPVSGSTAECLILTAIPVKPPLLNADEYHMKGGIRINSESFIGIGFFADP